MMMKRLSFALPCLLLLIQSCGMTGLGDFEDPQTFFSTMVRLHMEVAYEPGAEPFTGRNPSTGRHFWDILEDNLKAVFGGRDRVVTMKVPKSLGEMAQLPPQNRTSWTSRQLMDLAEANRMSRSNATDGHFYVLFVRGYLDRGGEPDPNVLGVSLGGTTVIAIFKEVVSSTGIHPNGAVPKFVEQSTLVHEMGHALGLVNNGVPMVSPHQDATNGKHCTNTQCVMYFQNEGKTALANFVDQFTGSQNVVMFGDECLRDTREFQP